MLKEGSYYPVYLEWFEGNPTETASIFSYSFNNGDWKYVEKEMYPSLTNTPGQIAKEYFEPPIEAVTMPTNNTVVITSTASTKEAAEVFDSGVRIMWQPARALGYRLFRSTDPNKLGISVTDFYITYTSYADVNVEPNTTYYYTVKTVLEEANPFRDIEERLGDTIATFTITTGGQVYKPGVFKHFILLKLNDPYMSVDGINSEVDEGRGTTPIILNGRTMVPIRAIVEAMGGEIGWDDASQKITLDARGSNIEMWINKKNITVNGSKKEMDISPILKNGRIFLPIRFVGENLKCKVDWINSTEEIVIVYED